MWDVVQALPVALGGAAAVTLAGLLYVTGGYSCIQSGCVAHPYLFAYNDSSNASNAWQPKHNMTVNRFFHAATVLLNRIYVVGGCNYSTPIATMEVYDVATNGWTLLASVAVPRLHLSLVAFDHLFYAMGGAWYFPITFY